MSPQHPMDHPQQPNQSHGADTLIALVYDKLRQLAGAILRGELADHTLQPTAVVHEAYVRLKRTGKRWESEADFRRYAAPVIRHVLVDYARARPSNQKVTIDSCEMAAAEGHQANVEILALDEALDRLQTHDPKLTAMVELRYFGGLTEEETAVAMELPLGTLKNNLTFARTWLRRELTRPPKL